MKFDTPIALSETSSLTPSEDFVYNGDGSIDVMRAGTYTVYWYVVSMTGFSKVGQSYQLQKFDYSLATPDWSPVTGTCNHIKVSQTLGFAILVVSEDEINDYGKATIALFNTADAVAKLTFFVPRGGILIVGDDLDGLSGKLNAVDNQVINITNRIENIDQFVHSVDITNLQSQSSELSGLGADVINSGYMYNFWGTGTLDHQQTLNAGSVYYLINSSQFEPLTYYQGTTTEGTLWIETPAPYTEVYSLPISFDATGIYFSPDTSYADLAIGTIFRFTQSLILVDTSP